MRKIQIRRTAAAAAGLAIVGGGILGAGIASAGGDTAAPKPGKVCGTTGINGEAQKTLPCSQVPTSGATFQIDASGTVRDGKGVVIGKYDPKTGTVTGTVAGNGPGAKPGTVTGPTGVGENGQGVVVGPVK
ncbi:hypothetical protein [Tsukamurella spumae]|uniref:Uncharacterized protein n=1 Tax=Tsukamurella spumae TaxID=44753 RepID=A0A846X148_9ACTN|nr:hypothetical protein [Tsukamurella spumae]NKY18913.1 hypothetical protein [Tsukamurella spumae]